VDFHRAPAAVGARRPPGPGPAAPALPLWGVPRARGLQP
jgi:hypothetical protein